MKRKKAKEPKLVPVTNSYDIKVLPSGRIKNLIGKPVPFDWCVKLCQEITKEPGAYAVIKFVKGMPVVYRNADFK